MNKQAYMIHLRELLENQYSDVKNNPSKSLAKNTRIEGYMQAGLVASVVTSKELKQVINDSHKKVFGVSFDERAVPNTGNEKIWDVPTWIRKGIEINE